MMDRNSYTSKIVIALTLTVFMAGGLYGQTAGKVRGTVTDEASGEALVGANVLIDGTNLGAASDENGEYFILNVRLVHIPCARKSSAIKPPLK